MHRDNRLTVLVVCAANQCRSCAGHALLATALADLPDVRVMSAGTHADGVQPVCPRAAEFLGGLAVPVDLERTSVELTAGLLAEADLVLVADGQVRADAVALDPAARPKVLLLRGAGRAAEFLLANDRVGIARAAHAAGLDRAVDITDGEEDVLTSALAPGLQAAAAWLREELAIAQAYAASDAHDDIADAHGSWRNRHPRTLEDVRVACEPLARLIRALAAS